MDPLEEPEDLTDYEEVLSVYGLDVPFSDPIGPDEEDLELLGIEVPSE